MSRFRNKKQKNDEKREVISNFALVSQLGIIMVTTIFISVLIGLYLDKWFQTTFIFTLIFSVLGVLAAFRNMYYQVMKK